ncbi:hypothetical protein C3B61_18320 [Cryobacterium zongtaii]|uniref:Uncharacterized protein n=2 Tax=Cryobacterium zongtaii TaxID=1259217 RepID=A0A2S3Z9D8_9MICO|nr:hypothetical protein C3B61_18320 [Cryobacterium zongtaii]
MISLLTCLCIHRLDTMPANLSTRSILWIGIGLITASVLVQVGRDLVYRLVATDSLQAVANSWWFGSFDVVFLLVVPLGTLMVAAFFVARLIERVPTVPAQPARRITAAGVFWAGIVFTLVGLLVVASLEGWMGTLAAQGRPSIALDALYFVVSPLRNIVIPLGLALLPASVLMKKLEVRSRTAQLPL